LIAAKRLGIVRQTGRGGARMRFQGAMALAVAVLLAGCGGGWFGSKSKPDTASDAPDEITKPIGPGLVARCPVPKSYDDATLKRIQDALQALQPDNILHKIMNDYEAERDNLRMCQ
jgi:hypothetical protein